MLHVKKLTRKPNSSEIKLSHENNVSDPQKVIALYVLLGGYNEYGRNIPIEVYNDLKARYNSLIDETVNLL